MPASQPLIAESSLRRVTVAFAVFSSLWLMLSDLLVTRALGIRGGTISVMLAGDLAFSLTTATLLHLALRRRFGRDAALVPEPLQKRMRVGPYLFAILFSTAMLFINDKVGEFAGQRSILLLSIFPIVFSAYEGGFGPGLVATLIPALLMEVVSPMPGSVGGLQSVFGLRQILLICAGLVVSALMGRLHGMTRRANQALKELSATSAQLASLNQELERRVADRTVALSVANEELESFAYAVSHDLRVPVRTMTGMVQVLKEDHADGLSDEARRCLDQIERAGERMSSLIGGLLSLSRDVSMPLHDDEVDLSAIAQEKLDELALNEPGRRVRREIEPGITARGDSRLLASALQNLLGNAWKFTALKGDARITVRSEQRNGKVWLSIEDDGPGFGAEHAQSLFRPFYRAHDSESAPGLGIGLATVRRIVQRHGGLIECEGRPGEGATFRFTLPTLASQAYLGR